MSVYYYGSAASNRPLDATAYAALINSIPNLVAYWPMDSAAADGLTDATGGGLDGTYDGGVSLVGGLPTGSDAAVRLGGTTRGIVPTDASLDLGAFTLSFWCSLHEAPEALRAILAREQSGLFVGDFGLYLDQGEFRAQFQDASLQHQIFGSASLDTPHHVAVTANSAGFQFWVDGRHIGTNTAFTGAWASNGNDLQFGSAVQLAEEIDATVDECAIWSRVLTDAEIITLSQRTAAPTAGDLGGITVTEALSVTLDVAGSSEYVGRKSALTITLGGEEAFGTASVNGSNDIVYTADAVTEDQADSFTYTITDANGTSASATISLTVLDSAGTNPGGGTLIYEFVPQDWITGVALSARDTNDVIGNIGGLPTTNRWTTAVGSGGGVTVGTARTTKSKGGNVCWNFAPTGEPALEMHCSGSGVFNVCDIAVELFEPLVAAPTNPRHMRSVIELRICKAADSNTHKPTGLGPTTGGSGYPNFSASHTAATGVTAVKYFCCIYQGEEQAGPAGSPGSNHWDTPTAAIQRVGHMLQTGSGSKTVGLYLSNFDRPNQGGGSNTGINSPASLNITHADVQGCWVRLELEVYLGDPDNVPEDARRTDPTTDPRPHSADGFFRLYATKDLDGEVGAPGTRQLIAELTGICMNPKYDFVGSFDNMHTLCTLTGPWIDFYYGGGTPSFAASWAWIRKLQVYRHD